VASSNLRLFGIKNGINDLRPIVENQPDNWRAEKVSDNTRKIILKYFSENMNPYDAAVLFWLARNHPLFELGLDKNPDVRVLRYEDLIMSPVESVSDIYGYLGQNFPGNKIIKEIHSYSIKKGRDIELSPEIDQLAHELLDRLDKAYHIKNG
jgi:hypothetical protein